MLYLVNPLYGTDHVYEVDTYTTVDTQPSDSSLLTPPQLSLPGVSRQEPRSIEFRSGSISPSVFVRYSYLGGAESIVKTHP